MDLEKFVSKSAKAGEIYNLEHFRMGWQVENLRRLMGNELVYPPSPKVIEAVEKVAALLNYYPEDPLTDVELRGKLAEYCGLPGRADWVTCGNGSMENIDLVYRTFLDEGDELLLSTPDYSPYTRRAIMHGAKVIDVLPDDGDFNYSLESFTSKITPRTKLALVSRPNNPDGHFVPRELVTGLLDTGIIVVIDEAYYEFGCDPIEDLLDSYPNLVICHTFSKAMGLAGIRLGWIFAAPEIVKYIDGVRQPLNISLVARTAAIAAIDDAAYIRENVARVIADRDFLFEELKKIPGLRPIPSQANFVMVDCLESGAKASEVYRHLLEKGYLIRCFVNGRGLPGDRFFRITIGTHEDTVNVLEEVKSFFKVGQLAVL
jgi:histidinol-phosphate aminotransferase